MNTQQASPTDTALIEQFSPRMGESAVRTRLQKERDYSTAKHTGPSLIDNARNWVVQHVCKWALTLTGLMPRGRKNASKLDVLEHEHRISGLPPALDGLRILHLSDTHIDIHPPLVPILAKHLRTLDYDICVHTGDFRDRTLPNCQEAVRLTSEFLHEAKTPVYGVLGNHDLLESVPELERAGLRLLLNEHTTLTVRGQSVALVGVDDSYYYKTGDLARAEANLPEHALKIFLAHSPGAYTQALGRGYALMLCGHTHGGQMNLRKGSPLLRNDHCEPDMFVGSWKVGELLGYTSQGAGCCAVPARFNCPPEISLHTLRCG